MYTFTGKIRYSETDAYGFLTPEKLIDYFQDCSTFQSEDLGIGVKKLRSQGLAWIIVYWRVEIYRMPVLGEEVRIGTIPYEMKDFEISCWRRLLERGLPQRILYGHW